MGDCSSATWLSSWATTPRPCGVGRGGSGRWIIAPVVAAVAPAPVRACRVAAPVTIATRFGSPTIALTKGAKTRGSGRGRDGMTGTASLRISPGSGEVSAATDPWLSASPVVSAPSPGITVLERGTGATAFSTPGGRWVTGGGTAVGATLPVTGSTSERTSVCRCLKYRHCGRIGYDCVEMANRSGDRPVARKSR